MGIAKISCLLKTNYQKSNHLTSLTYLLRSVILNTILF